MDVSEVAKEFTQLLKDGKDQEAQDRFWADTIRSIEAGPSHEGDYQDLTGREAIMTKHAWWEANTTVHDVSFKGPMVNGNAFAVIFSMDVTMKGFPRMQMEEVGLYTVADGKIVEERFFYGPFDEPEGAAGA
ncbi:MAG: nuclear transport factor 2 family protein [Pseudomonadota bacterium]